MLLGQDPIYLRTCRKVLSDIGISDIHEFNDVELANQFLQTVSVPLAVLCIKDVCTDEWISFLNYLNSVRIPFVIVSASDSDLLIENAVKLQAQGFYCFPKDQASFSFYIKKLSYELGKNQSKKSFVIRHKRVFINVLQAQIVKILTQGNYSYVYLITGKKYVVKKPLKRILEKLDNTLIIQCHRSTAFNITMLERIEMVERKLILINGDVLKLGNNYKHRVRRTMEYQFD